VSQIVGDQLQHLKVASVVATREVSLCKHLQNDAYSEKNEGRCPKSHGKVEPQWSLKMARPVWGSCISGGPVPTHEG
jgi:hypothetical protein